MLHVVSAVFILFFGCSRVQSQTCSTNSLATLITKANPSNFVCKRDACFGGSNGKASFDLNSNDATKIESLACGYNPDRLQQADCPTLINVAGKSCKQCACTAINIDSVKWHEQVSSGRTCRLYRCTNLTSGGTACSSTNTMAYLVQTSTSFLPQSSVISQDQGVYLPTSNVLHSPSLKTSYDEWGTANYSCPMTQVCKTLPTGASLPQNVLGYARGTYYTARSNNSCLIDYCAGTAWVSWSFQTGEIAGTSQLNFVKQQCPTSSYLRFQRCYNGNGKLYFQFASSSCSTRSSFCNRFYCECPPANRNMPPWYERYQTERPIPSGFSATPVPSDYISGKQFRCQQYTCDVLNISATIQNVYYQAGPTVSPTVLPLERSFYGPVSPCDASLGYLAKVGEYYRYGTALNSVFAKLPMQRRSPAILIFRSLEDPLLLSVQTTTGNQSYQTAISNATCKMLGVADCYEVKAYDVAVSTQTACPELGRPSTTAQICSTLSSNCVDTQKQSGRFVNTRIQCFGNRENFVMNPVCKKNANMQSAYANLDQCLNDMNYVLNVYSKVVGGSCNATNFFTRWIQEGQCDHPVIRQFLTHTGGCYCAFINTMSDSSTPEMRQSAQAMGDTVLNSNRSPMISALKGIIADIGNYGCNVVPFRCSGGSVSYTLRRPTMSGSFKVKTYCKHVNVGAVRSKIETFLVNAKVVLKGYKNARLRITNLINGTNECTLQFSAFVTNTVWAEYLQRNTSQRKPLNGEFNSVYDSITLNGVGSAVSASSSLVTFEAFVFLVLSVVLA